MTRARTSIRIGMLLTIAAGGCGGSGRTNPQPAARATRGLAPKPPKPGSLIAGTGAVATNSLVLAQSAQVWPAFTLASGGVSFILGVDEAGVVRYVSTTDHRFLTTDGVSVGMDYRSVLAAAAGHAAKREPGWAYYVELPSGWGAAFVVGPGMTDGPLAAESPVRWLFQRIGYGSPASTQDTLFLHSGGSGGSGPFGGGSK